MTETRSLIYKSLSLNQEDLNNFEDILLKDSEFIRKNVTVGFKAGDFRQEISKESIRDIIKEPLLPNIIKSLTIHFTGPEHMIYIRTFSDEIKISIEGNSNWVRVKSEEIKTFLDKKRTYTFIFSYDYLFYPTILVSMLMFIIIIVATELNILPIGSASTLFRSFLVFPVVMALIFFFTMVIRSRDYFPILRLEIHKNSGLVGKVIDKIIKVVIMILSGLVVSYLMIRYGK